MIKIYSYGIATEESRGNTEVVRCVVVQIGRAVGEQYGVRRADGCTSVKRIIKKLPPGQTLFSNFLFFQPLRGISIFLQSNPRKIFLGPPLYPDLLVPCPLKFFSPAGNAVQSYLQKV